MDLVAKRSLDMSRMREIWSLLVGDVRERKKGVQSTK